MESECNIPNCRKKAPDTEAFCAEHRTIPKSDAGGFGDPPPGGLEAYRNRRSSPASGTADMVPRDVAESWKAKAENYQQERADALADIADMMVNHVENWPAPKKLSTAIALIGKTLDAMVPIKGAADIAGLRGLKWLVYDEVRGLLTSTSAYEAAAALQSKAAMIETLAGALVSIRDGGGMLSQPAALNCQELEWANKRIWRLESIAREALTQLENHNVE